MPATFFLSYKSCLYGQNHKARMDLRTSPLRQHPSNCGHCLLHSLIHPTCIWALLHCMTLLRQVRKKCICPQGESLLEEDTSHTVVMLKLRCPFTEPALSLSNISHIPIKKFKGLSEWMIMWSKGMHRHMLRHLVGWSTGDSWRKS